MRNQQEQTNIGAIESGSDPLAVQVQHDNRLVNGVNRSLARAVLLNLAAWGLLHMFWATALLLGTVHAGLNVYAGEPDKVSVLLFGALLVFSVFTLCMHFGRLGAAIAAATRPLDQQVSGLVDGVSSGKCELRLGKESVGWCFEHSCEELHLSAFFNFWRRGGIVFLCSSLVLVHYLHLTGNARTWFDELRQRRRAAPKDGWLVPKSDADWTRFELPLEAVASQAQRDQSQNTANGSLISIAFSLLGLLGTSVFFFVIATRISESNVMQLALFVFVVLWLGYLLVSTAKPGLIALRQRKNGVNILDHQRPGLTHGTSAYKVTGTGFELRRAFLKHSMNWAGVDSADQHDGWIALRAGGNTQAILPDTSALCQILTDKGLIPDGGPWHRKADPQTWRRAA